MVANVWYVYDCTIAKIGLKQMMSHAFFGPDGYNPKKTMVMFSMGDDIASTMIEKLSGYRKDIVIIGYRPPEDVPFHLDYIYDVSDEGDLFDFTFCMATQLCIP